MREIWFKIVQSSKANSSVGAPEYRQAMKCVARNPCQATKCVARNPRPCCQRHQSMSIVSSHFVSVIFMAYCLTSRAQKKLTT